MTDTDDLAAKLETQRDAWKARWEKAQDDIDRSSNRAIRAVRENTRLRAEVERLQAIVADLTTAIDFHLAGHGKLGPTRLRAAADAARAAASPRPAEAGEP